MPKSRLPGSGGDAAVAALRASVQAGVVEMAVSVIPAAPGTVEVAVGEKGTTSGRVVSREGAYLVAAVAAGWVRPGARCDLWVVDDRRAGYRIGVKAVAVHSTSGSDVVTFGVVEVRRLKSRRSEKRAEIGEFGVVQHRQDVDVRVVDASSKGFAFISKTSIPVGATLSIMMNLQRRVLPVVAQVRYVESTGFGRFRVGCRITRISDTHRAILEDVIANRDAPSDRRATRTPSLDQPHDAPQPNREAA